MKRGQELAIYALPVILLLIVINVMFWVIVVIPMAHKEKVTMNILTKESPENPISLIDLLNTNYNGKLVYQYVEDYINTGNSNNLVEAVDYLLKDIPNYGFYVNEELVCFKGEIEKANRKIKLNLEIANLTLAL